MLEKISFILHSLGPKLAKSGSSFVVDTKAAEARFLSRVFRSSLSKWM